MTSDIGSDYGPLARTLHWLAALCVIVAWLSYMTLASALKGTLCVPEN